VAEFPFLIRISIVSIHAINGGPCQKDNSEGWVDHLPGTAWLETLLPWDMPNARIMAYKAVYDTEDLFAKTTADLMDCVHSLLLSLVQLREKLSVG
jgi:hypothetical protein